MSENGSAGRIIDLLDEATPADLAEVDRQVAAIRARLAALDALRSLLAARLNIAPAPPAPGAGGKGGGQPGQQTVERRMKLANELARTGPMTAANAAKFLGVYPSVAASVFHCDWFAVEGDRVHITPAGRQACA